MTAQIPVSLILITFNSSKYVLETLESVKNQTMKDFELIISDDGSNDNTCDLIKNWLSVNSHEFKRIEFHKNTRNEGIVSNCNKGLRHAKGKWIKFIAGDDILLPNCISDNLTFVTMNPGIRFLFSDVKILSEVNQPAIKFHKLKSNSGFFYSLPPEKQFCQLLKYNFAFAPTAFISHNVLISFGRFDQKYRNIEDYPLWLKVTKAGYKLDYMEIETVIYRIHNNAISSQGYSNAVVKDMQTLFFNCLLPNISLSNCLYIWDTYLKISTTNIKVQNILKYFSPLYLINILTRDGES